MYGGASVSYFLLSSFGIAVVQALSVLLLWMSYGIEHVVYTVDVMVIRRNITIIS